MTDNATLLPCPFCGTRPNDDASPHSVIETPGHIQIECGKCAACWPSMPIEAVKSIATIDAEMAAFLNRRAAPPFNFGYERIVNFFDSDNTAAEFMSEDGEGGFAGAVYRMAREIDMLRNTAPMTPTKPTVSRAQYCELEADQIEREEKAYKDGFNDGFGEAKLGQKARANKFAPGTDYDAAAHVRFLREHGGGSSGYTADLIERLHKALGAKDVSQ